MSEAFTITLEGKGKAAELLEKKYAAGLPLAYHSAIAKAAAQVVEKHLKTRDHTHANQLGGRRSHFYWHAGESVRGIPTPEGAEVTINQLGLRQRWLGGEIRPVHAKMLAIPARAESYGIRPRDFPGELKLIRFHSGAMALVKADPMPTFTEFTDASGQRHRKWGRQRRLKTSGLVEYWLKDVVYQNPDPTVLPTPEEILTAVSDAASAYLTENQ